MTGDEKALEETQRSWLELGAVFQQLPARGELSGLLTLIATTENVLVRADEKLTAFLELERVTLEPKK